MSLYFFKIDVVQKRRRSYSNVAGAITMIKIIKKIKIKTSAMNHAKDHVDNSCAKFSITTWLRYKAPGRRPHQSPQTILQELYCIFLLYFKKD